MVTEFPCLTGGSSCTHITQCVRVWLCKCQGANGVSDLGMSQLTELHRCVLLHNSNPRPGGLTTHQALYGFHFHTSANSGCTSHTQT